MAAPIFKKTKVEQTIDLKEVFGTDFRGMRSLREAIGEAILNRIRERSQSGQGVSFSGNRARPVTLKTPYSKEYADSLDFKAFGKSRSNVNMTLTGDMLNLMDIKRQNGNSITIGWNDSTENAKAFNHSTGDTVPRRPFFGVSKTELSDIKKEFKSEIQSAIDAKSSQGRRAFEQRVADIFQELRAVEPEDVIDG